MVPKNISELAIISMNVCGFGNKMKRRAIISHLERFKPGIICLSDTRLDENSELMVRNEFEYNCFFNSLTSTSNSRGVAIMIKKSLPVTVEKVLKDGSGNWIIISIKYESRIINISNIYGPNEDSPQFFEDLFNNINGHGLGNCIITGDFNTTLNFTLDNENYAATQNNQARATLNQLISDFEYFDTYRELEGEKRDYTWFKKGGAQKGRLDMFLASNSLKT